MVNFTIDEFQSMLGNIDQIRNISIIGCINSGKSTVSDCLIAKNGIIILKKANNYCCRDYCDEQEREVLTKNLIQYLYYNYKDCKIGFGDTYLMSLINSSTHSDLSFEVVSTLRTTDGVIVLVEYGENVPILTEIQLRQALMEKVRPIVMINKLDRSILELHQDGEQIFQNISRVIDQINANMYGFDHLGSDDFSIHPAKGNIAFGSGKEGWGFTLTKFALMYSKKFGIDVDKLVQMFWGDNYYNPETKQWGTQNITENGQKLQRGFVQFIMEPIIRLTRAIMDGNEERVSEMVNILDISLSSEDKERKGKFLLKSIFSKWIDLVDCLLEMSVLYLPSPREAQTYRVAYLYQGPQDDICAEGIRKCDPNGPLMIYISRMLPISDGRRFYAFGRVFSGTVNTGQKVRIMGPNYKPGKKEDLAIKHIQRVAVIMGRIPNLIDSVPCGNIVGLIGIDQYLSKTGTISDYEEACNIRTIKPSLSPLLRTVVEPKNAADLPKLIENLRKIAKSDASVLVSHEENGDHVIAGNDERHLEACLNNLQTSCEITHSDPFVTYKETISQTSRVCLAKSPNKHNRFYCVAQPFSEDLGILIEKGEVSNQKEVSQNIKILADDFGWEKEDVEKIWAFGPEERGPNLLVNLTKNVNFISEIKDSCVAAFQWATKEGVLCEEPLRNVRMNIVDVSLHSDAIHRGGGQIIPTARRAYYGCELTSQPRLIEPIYLLEVNASKEVRSVIYECLAQRNAIVMHEETITGPSLIQIKSYLPVANSFGLSSQLTSITGGKALAECIFSHWSILDSDPLEHGTKAFEIMVAIRKRKGLREEPSSLENYIDNI